MFARGNVPHSGKTSTKTLGKEQVMIQQSRRGSLVIVAAMAAAVKSTAELEAETNALRRSQLERWKKFVGG